MTNTKPKSKSKVDPKLGSTEQNPTPDQPNTKGRKTPGGEPIPPKN